MNRFDQHLKNKLQKPQAPPLDAWRAIERKLPSREEKKKRPLFFWLISSAACVGIVLGVFLTLDNTENTEDSTIVHFKSPLKASKKVPITRDLRILPNDQVSLHYMSTPSYKAKPVPEIYPSLNIPRNLQDEIGSTSNAALHVYLNKYLALQSDDKLVTSTNEHSNELLHPLDSVSGSFVSASEIAVLENEEHEPSIESLLKKNEADEAEKIAVGTTHPLILTSHVSPTLLMDQKSMLSTTFDAYPIKNEVTIAYGAKLSYSIGQALKIRAGISKIELEQSTAHVTTSTATVLAANDVVQMQNIARNNPENIRYTGDLNVLNNAAFFPEKFYASAGNTLHQQIEYFEIPLEIEVNLLKTGSFNLSAIGGGSYYTLSKNEIYIDNATQKRQRIGEATNLNSSSFSLNMGIKAEYLLYNKFGIYLEPYYHYMIQPVRDTHQTSTSLLGIHLGFSLQLK